MIFDWLNRASLFLCFSLRFYSEKSLFPLQAWWLIFSVNTVLQVFCASLYLLSLLYPFQRVNKTKCPSACLLLCLLSPAPPPFLKKGQMNDAHCTDKKLSPHSPRYPSPPSLLMSNASSIDLLVDLKEIQSQMPQVAFFPLWEIKRFNSPCLSTLIIIISPSSPFVCLPLPRTPTLPAPRHSTWLSLCLSFPLLTP